MEFGKEKPKKRRRFDLIALEAKCMQAYLGFLEGEKDGNTPSKEARDNLFLSIYNLTFAIMSVSRYVAKARVQDHVEEMAQTYTLTLFSRIIRGFRFTFDDKIPFQKYIDLNMKQIVSCTSHEQSSYSAIEDLNNLVIHQNYADDEEDGKQDYEERCIVRKIYKILNVYYSSNQIRRYLPLAIEFLDRSKSLVLSKDIPETYRDFTNTLIAIAYSVCKEHNIRDYISTMKPQGDLKNIISTSVRSSVFLHSIVNSEIIDPALLVSLDMSSLSRLISVAGGKKIKIPTEATFDRVLTSVLAISEGVVTGKEPLDALKSVSTGGIPIYKKDVTLQNYVQSISKTMELKAIDPETEPLINVLENVINATSALSKKLPEVIDSIPKERLVSDYMSLSKNLQSLIKSLESIQDRFEKGKLDG